MKSTLHHDVSGSLSDGLDFDLAWSVFGRGVDSGRSSLDDDDGGDSKMRIKEDAVVVVVVVVVVVIIVVNVNVKAQYLKTPFSPQ